MDRTFAASAALTALSAVGYVAGTLAPYPGREASLAGLMVGVALVIVTYGGRGNGDRDRNRDRNGNGGGEP